MRRQAIVIFGLLTVFAAAAPERADARGIIPGIFGMMTRPFHALFGGHRHARRSHSRGAVAATAGAGAAVAAAKAKATETAARAKGTETVDRDIANPAVIWPSAYQDVLGYAFWPQDYGPRLQAHGYTDILAAVFEPAGRIGSIRPKASETPGSGSSDNDTASACGDDQTSPQWPAEKLEQTLQLDDGQKKSLDQLRAASAEANKAIQASCGEEVARTPAERLSSMQTRLWAVRDAT